MKSIPIFLIALIFLALPARPAGGQIIVSEETAGFFDHGGIDLNRDGVANIRFSWSHLVTMDFPSSAQASLLEVTPVAGSRIRTVEFSSAIGTGTYIGPGLLDSDWDDRSWRTVTSYHTPGSQVWSGMIGELGYGFVGFSFDAESGTHYGWVRLELNEMPFAPGSSTSWPRIDSWAYQTQPDVAIAAGQIPEPSRLAAVAGLAALGFVLLLRRTRFGVNRMARLTR